MKIFQPSQLSAGRSGELKTLFFLHKTKSKSLVASRQSQVASRKSRKHPKFPVRCHEQPRKSSDSALRSTFHSTVKLQIILGSEMWVFAA